MKDWEDVGGLWCGDIQSGSIGYIGLYRVDRTFSVDLPEQVLVQMSSTLLNVFLEEVAESSCLKECLGYHEMF